MNKLFTKIVGVCLGLTMAVGVGVAVASNSREATPVHASASTAEYVFTDKNYNGKLDGTTYTLASTLSSVTAGSGFTANQGIQHTSGTTSTATTVASYSKVTKITVLYCTNSKRGAGTIKFKVGSGTEQSFSVTAPSSGGTTQKSHDFTFDEETGVVKVTCSATANSVYLYGFTVTYDAGTPSKTVTALEVLDGNANELTDGDEINVAAGGAGSASAEVTCEVTYSSGDPDGLVDITSEPSAGFSVDTEDDSTYSMTFTANGDYDVTIATSLDDSVAITVTYHVSGIVAVVYKKVTSTANLKAGSEFIIGKADGTYVMSQYSSGNNCASLSVTPTDADNIPASAIPSGYAIFTLSGSSTGWTLTDQDSKIYYGTSGQNYLKSSTTATDTWTISISSGVATITSAASSRSIKKNQSSALFSTYASGQHDISIYMIPSTDPAIEVEITGSTSLAVGGTATLTATKVNGATGTVTWSKNNNHVTLSSTTGDSITVTGATDGSTDVTASLTGGSSVDPVVTTFTVTKALSSIAVTTAPTKTTYTEGESFDNTGMVVTATYDDASTETPSDYTWSPSGALTSSDTSITISWGGKTTTQAITVNAKVVSSIAVQSGPTKNSYHAGDEFVSAGLTIRVTYEGGSTADITSGFTISPDSYTFTAADETAGSKTFTVTYGGKSTTFSVTVAGVTGPIASGRYYIMNSDKTHGLNAVAATGASPTALSLSTANELTAFDVILMADNEYEISVSINETKYILVCNTTATSSSNTSIRVTNSPSGSLKTNYWNLDDDGVETEGAYYVKENTTGTTYRYLACYSTTDWRGYTGASGDREIQFVPEGSYAESVADSLLNDITCDDGVHAPSTSVWSDISDAYSDITIAHEKALLTGGTADEESEDTIEQALARYDYIVGKYNKGQGITAYNDFLSRNPSSVGNSRFILNAGFNGNSNTVAIIVVISMISVTCIGGCFFLRKRKEN